MLLLALPQSQHQHAHGDVDGRTEPTVGARRKLPFANALADFHQTTCSQVFREPARAMEPTAASDGHRIRANSNSVIRLPEGRTLYLYYKKYEILQNANSISSRQHACINASAATTCALGGVYVSASRSYKIEDYALKRSPELLIETY